MRLLSSLVQPRASAIPPLHAGPEPWRTWANLVTLVRAVAGLALFAVAAALGSEPLNFIGLAVYWVLDIADGAVARALRQETRLGAQLDILADRLLCFFFYFNYMSWHPGVIVPVSLFMFQFAFLDHFLSNQFIRWPILSPNYFHAVDRVVWALNWTGPAKVVNGALMLCLLVGAQAVWVASAFSIVMMGVKVYSIRRLARLPPPEDEMAGLPRRARLAGAGA
jgi:CDP-diacylglycerol--glycerol-3-phosphate 3-phosphatidyltransferase